MSNELLYAETYKGKTILIKMERGAREPSLFIDGEPVVSFAIEDDLSVDGLKKLAYTTINGEQPI